MHAMAMDTNYASDNRFRCSTIVSLRVLRALGGEIMGARNYFSGPDGLEWPLAGMPCRCAHKGYSVISDLAIISFCESFPSAIENSAVKTMACNAVAGRVFTSSQN